MTLGCIYKLLEQLTGISIYKYKFFNIGVFNTLVITNN